MRVHTLRRDDQRVISEVKPRLRGWTHAAITPFALLGGLVLVLGAPTPAGQVGGAVYVVCSVLLFGTSAVYHRGTWSERHNAVLRRLDHSNIFLFIAGTYTPLALLLLDGGSGVLLLTLVWGIAIAGVLFRVLWLAAPRWLYTVLYLAMGWAALGWLPAFYRSGGPLVFALIIGGGLIYSAGALVYGRRRPNPWPAWFGFHEIFHLCTIVAAALHYAAICLVTFRAG